MGALSYYLDFHQPVHAAAAAIIKKIQIVDLLFTKHAERGMTLVLVTHDASLARRCDRVVRLRSGHIDGPAS